MQKLIKFNLAHEGTMMRFCEFLSNEIICPWEICTVFAYLSRKIMITDVTSILYRPVFVCPHSNVLTLTSPPVLKLWDTQRE